MLCFNVTKSEIDVFPITSERVQLLLFNIDRMHGHIEQDSKFDFLGIIIDPNQNWKVHLNAVGIQFSRTFWVLHK